MNMFSSFLRRAFLPATVALTGACVLVIEVVAVRVLAPYFGTTLYTVSSILSVILFALSCGYAIGGRIADAYPRVRTMYGIIFWAGVAELVCYGLGSMLLPVMSMSMAVAFGALISSALLFFVPAFLLGMLSPYAVVLQKHIEEDTGLGTSSGTIFFWSTLGSICGSLLTGFVFIPHVGVRMIMIATGVVLCVLGMVPYLLRSSFQRLGMCMMFGFGLLCAYGGSTLPYAHALAVVEGTYERIIIFDGEYNGRPVRFLQQDHNLSAAQYRDSIDPLDVVFEYTQYYVLYQLFAQDPEEVLAIGGGAYSVPMAIAHQEPQAHVHTVEIEPELFSLVQKYFVVDAPERFSQSVGDGRRFLSTTTTTYDVIFSDVYQSKLSIPAHFVTKEFFTLAQERLSENGVFIANVIGSLNDDGESFLLSEMRTFQESFPRVAFFAVTDPRSSQMQNHIFVGWKNVNAEPFEPSILARQDHALLRTLDEHRVDMDAGLLDAYPVFTDDYAPVEYLLAQDLKDEGGK